MSYWLGISNTVIYLLIYSIFLLQVTCWGILVSSALLEIVAQIYTFSMNLHVHVFHYLGNMLPTYTFWPSPYCTQRHGLVQDKGFSFFSIFLSLFYTSPQVRFMSEFLFISLPLCCSWSVFSPFSCWGPSYCHSCVIVFRLSSDMINPSLSVFS